MAQDKVQLKREEVVGNDIVMQDINPKTKTNSITDSTKGVPLDQTLAMIKNMINNKLSRVVNSVNGRTGVVILDAGDVGLENVDNISFGDIKRWVIEYIGDIFGTKRIILKEYLSEIHTIIGTNDKAYADTPFYCEKGAEDVSDYMAYIGYIYWDAEHELLKEEHLQIKVVGFTDKSLRYSVANTPYANGGLGVNIWKGEDALKVMNNAISYSGYTKEDMDNSGLYIDKTKVVPNVYFFDGVYGTLTGSGDNMHNENALVYWTTDPSDTTEGNLPIIEIYVNDVSINKASSGGGTVNTLHTSQSLKEGDIIITNFSYVSYFNPDDPVYINKTYPKIIDALTCCQPAMGRVVQGATAETDNTYIVKFYTMKPNVSHGLKLISTNTYNLQSPADTAIGLDLMTATPVMSDNTTIYPAKTNISGINAMDQYVLNRREPESRSTTKKICTIFPTGKSANILDQSDGKIPSSSAYIMPNFSMCVIPGYIFVNHGYGQGVGKIKNWNPSSPIDYNDTTVENVFGRFNWNMIGLNLEKMIFNSAHNDQNSYARNISGLRVNNDEELITESWLGHGSGSTKIADLHSGGVSVNVGDFLGIGTAEEITSTSYSDRENYYDEGKVNVRIDKMKGLYGVTGNRLAVNIAGGYSYAPEGVTHNWLEGGLTFVDGGTRAPAQGVLAVNTAEEASGLGIKNSYKVNIRHANWDNRVLADTFNNVLVVKPAKFTESLAERAPLTKSGLEVHNQIQEEDFANKITFTNIYNQRMWLSESELHNDIIQNPSNFDTTHIYIAGGKRFIYAEPQGQRTEISLFMYYSDESEYNAILTWIRTGNDSDVPDTSWAIHGYTLTPNEHTTANDECLAILRRQCHVLIVENPNELHGTRYRLKASISKPTTSEDLRFPDFDRNGIVVNTESSAIHAYALFITKATYVYSTTVGGQKVFYTDAGLTTPLVPVEGRGYLDMNDYLVDPENSEHIYYMPYKAVKDPGSDIVYLKKYEFALGRPATLYDVMCADVDRNGRFLTVDGTFVLKYYANCSSGMYPDMTPEESWRTYLRESSMNIVVGSGAREVYQVLDMIYNPGVRVRYNEQKGLTTFPNYFGNTAYDTQTLMENDMKDALAIKIADTTSGMFEFDPATAGGLRFGSNGYLAVRVNNNNHYSSALPIKNNPAHIDDLTIGSHGLRIYNTNNAFNVLGIQLSRDGSLDNGELRIDAQGCLRLSGAIDPNIKKLKFKCGGNVVEYDGKDEVTIEFGSGMIVTEHIISNEANSQL